MISAIPCGLTNGLATLERLAYFGLFIVSIDFVFLTWQCKHRVCLPHRIPLQSPHFLQTKDKTPKVTPLLQRIMAEESNDILIIGGGVAGLVLAQGLKHRGIPFKVFEHNERLSTKSHGYRFRCEAAGLEALQETLSPEMWDLLEKTHAKDR